MSQPRIPPGSRRDIGLRNALTTRVIGAAVGGHPPNLFTTLARHRRLYRRWLRFAAALMPGGRLPRRDAELVILRVAHNCSCEYERQHHVVLGRRAGLTAAQIDAVAGKDPADDGLWTARQRALLEAADQLHEHRRVDDSLWQRLDSELAELELIELPMLVGHYEMLAMTLNSLRVQPDPPATYRTWLPGMRRGRRKGGAE